MSVVEASDFDEALDRLVSTQSVLPAVILVDSEQLGEAGLQRVCSLRVNKALESVFVILMTPPDVHYPPEALNEVGIDGAFSKPRRLPICITRFKS